MSYTIKQSTARDQGRCKTWECCGLDEPLANYTTELDTPDRKSYLRIDEDDDDPLLGEDWEKEGCISWCYSTISQADADRCAMEQNKYCRDPGVPWCYNDPQSCTVRCADGGEFTASVPGGLFLEKTCEEANARAVSLCQSQAEAINICLIGDLPDTCYVAIYDERISIQGTAVPASAAITTGSLPAGITMALVGNELVFSGAALEWGGFRFEVAVTAASGAVATKELGFCVNRIVTPDNIEDLTPIPPIVDAYLEDSTLGELYSVQFIAQTCCGTGSWAKISGAIPPGLTLDTAGRIYGVPTVVGTYSFEIAVTDCTTGTHPVIPTPTPTPAGLLAYFTVQPVPGYFPITLSFQDRSTGLGNLTYLWDFGDGGTSTDRNPTHTYSERGITTRIVRLTVFDGHISDTFYRQVNLCSMVQIKDFDVTEWAIVPNGAIWKQMADIPPVPTLTGNLACLTSELNFWNYRPLLAPGDTGGAATPNDQPLYFVDGHNSAVANNVFWYIEDPITGLPVLDPRPYGYYFRVAFTLKKNIPLYPNAWFFQVWVSDGWYTPVFPYAELWVCKYIAVKPFVVDEAHEIPTGTYTWLDDDTLLGDDAGLIKTTYGLPDTIELVFPL